MSKISRRGLLICAKALLSALEQERTDHGDTKKGKKLSDDLEHVREIAGKWYGRKAFDE